MLQGVERLVFSNAIAAGAAGDVEIVHDYAHGFGYADSGDHEIRAAQPEGGKSDEERSQHRDGRAADKAEVWSMAGVHQQRGSVSAETEEDGKAEGDLAGHAAKQVPTQAGRAPNRCEKEKPDEIGIGVCSGQ